MSDTLQEREDQMTDNEASVRGFDQCQHDYGDGIRCCIYRNCHENQYMDHRFTETDYCDECKGRPHAPWCSLSESDKEVNNLPRITYACPNCGKVDEHSDSCPSRPRTSEREPAARGGGDEWRYIETTGSAEIRVGQITLRPHWAGLADGNEIRALFQQIITEHHQHQSLVAERERLLTMLKLVVASYIRSDDHGVAAQAARDTLAAIEQRSTSE